MSRWDAMGDKLIRAFSGGKGAGEATIRDRAAPSTAAKTCRVVVTSEREGEDLGLSGSDQLVMISGVSLGSLDMNAAKTVTLGGRQYRFNPLPAVGIRDPAASASGNAPIVRGVLSTGAR